MRGQARIESTSGLVADEANGSELLGLDTRFDFTQQRQDLGRFTGMQHCYRLLKR